MESQLMILIENRILEKRTEWELKNQSVMSFGFIDRKFEEGIRVTVLDSLEWWLIPIKRLDKKRSDFSAYKYITHAKRTKINADQKISHHEGKSQIQSCH
jgi:hypothetical protein